MTACPETYNMSELQGQNKNLWLLSSLKKDWLWCIKRIVKDVARSHGQKGIKGRAAGGEVKEGVTLTITIAKKPYVEPDPVIPPEPDTNPDGGNE